MRPPARRASPVIRMEERAGNPEKNPLKRTLNRRAFIKNLVRGAVALGLAKGWWNHRHIEPVRVPIEAPWLPAPFNGLRIALLSDFHVGFWVGAGLLETAGRVAMSFKPHLIFLLGDFITGATLFFTGKIGGFKEKHLDLLKRHVSRLKAELGLFGVLGNHDFWSGPAAVQNIERGLTDSGVRLLRNSSVRIERGSSHLNLAGVDDYWEDSFDLTRAISGLPQAEPKILLSHNPDVNESIYPEMGIKLVLSGHTHGGQVVVPGLGAPYLPSKFGNRYRAGLVRDGERLTYVTRGVGVLVAPIRINCPPEVTLITLYRGG